MPAAVRVQLGAALAATGTEDDFDALRRLMTRAARAALRREHVADVELSITLLDDDEIASLNQQYLSHESPTDVISFALYEDGEMPIGDIYIGYAQARRQAAVNHVPLREELARLTIHGVLHVLGHDHPEGDDRLTCEMWQVQEDILSRLRVT